jgi:hypothetical protein
MAATMIARMAGGTVTVAARQLHHRLDLARWRSGHQVVALTGIAAPLGLLARRPSDVVMLVTARISTGTAMGSVANDRRSHCRRIDGIAPANCL